MPTLQRIIDLSILIFVAVLMGMSLVLGWATPLEGRTLPVIESRSLVNAAVFGEIQGTIRNKRGEAVRGAKVSLFQPGKEEPVTVTETDDLGRYRMHELNAGLFILQTEHAGFETSRKVVMVEVHGRCTMDVILADASSGPASGGRDR